MYISLTRSKRTTTQWSIYSSTNANKLGTYTYIHIYVYIFKVFDSSNQNLKRKMCKMYDENDQSNHDKFRGKKTPINLVDVYTCIYIYMDVCIQMKVIGQLK